ncbi:MAG: hypothetical protein FWD64_05275 [Acidobacteriaceae bacterium]|nr:hypothetical protein [Acidobacteriaceae bacterium]
MNLTGPRFAAVLLALVLAVPFAGMSAQGQQPVGVDDLLSQLSDQPGSHVSFSLDRSTLDAARGYLGDKPAGVVLNSITFDTYRYSERAFYIPETMNSVNAAYHAAGWRHLINTTSPAKGAQPAHPVTDLWLHYHGTEIDDVTVLVRAPREMSLIQISGMLRPLDLIHLGGHFGIPKVDPNAVMVPAPEDR